MQEVSKQAGATINDLQPTLNRFAKIGFGISWSAGHDIHKAQEIVSFTLVTLMYHFGIPKSPVSNRMIRVAVEVGSLVYYSKTGYRREAANPDDEAIHFEEKL